MNKSELIKYKDYHITKTQYFANGHWFDQIYIQDPQLRRVFTGELKNIQAAKLTITKLLKTLGA